MVVFMPNLIAVHDTRNGQLIWKKEHDNKCRCVWLFITKHISGYVSIKTRRMYEITIFCTKTGDLIKVEELQKGTPILQGSITARGTYVCYIEESNWHISVHVIKVTGENVTKYNFRLPLERIFGQDEMKAMLMQNFEQSLLGFLGKSNILLCSVKAIRGAKLYSFDVDAAVSAKSDKEVKQAMSLPFFLSRPLPSYDDHYSPIYQTDRTNGSVDIVGVMLHKARGVGLVEAFYFVTEMQY